MRKAELLALADRVEALTGPDRLIDAEVTVALRLPHTNGKWALNFPEWEPDHTDKGRVWAVGNINGNGSHRSGSWISQPYTASLDAAMTLVPEGAFWSVTMRGEHRGGYHACCQMDGPLDWREGATPALALTAASLRAIANGGEA